MATVLVRMLRKYKRQTVWGGEGYFVYQASVLKQVGPTEAELLSSRIRGLDNHLLVLDLDCAAELYPSTTPGHHHLIVDKSMTWRQMKRVLRALAAAGVIEKSWAKASIKSGHALVSIKGKV